MTALTRWRRRWPRRPSPGERRRIPEHPPTTSGSVGRMSEINTSQINTSQINTSEITALSDDYVVKYTRSSPMMATYIGVPGGEDRLDDLSPAGLADANELVLRTLRAVQAAPSTGTDDDIARDVLVERLEVARDLYDSGWAHAALNVIASPVQDVRMVFDLMPTETDDEVEILARRMAAVPAALAGYQESLLAAAAEGRVAALRQVDKCAIQCDTYSGITGTGFFAGLAESVNADGR